MELERENRQPLWDDEAFRVWVEEGAQAQEMTLTEVLRLAGVSRRYLKIQPKQNEGRSTNSVMNLARVLDQSPAALMGMGPDFVAFTRLNDAAVLWNRRQKKARRRKRVIIGEMKVTPTPYTVAETSRQMAVLLIGLIYTESVQGGADPREVLSRLYEETTQKLLNGDSPTNIGTTADAAEG